MRAAGLILALLLSAPVHAAVDPATFHSFAFRQHPGAQLPLEAQINDADGRTGSLASAA